MKKYNEELSNPDSQSKLLPIYQSLKKSGVVEVVCDFCAFAFGVKEKIGGRQLPLVSEYKGRPSIEKWIKKGYRLIIL